MHSLLQLLLAVIAVYSLLKFTGDLRLYIPLGCLISMFIIGRLEKERLENREARKRFLKSEIERISKGEPPTIKKQELFIIHSLLRPKGELILTDAVHSIFKDLGFKVATGGKYNLVDRIVRIPDTQLCFGLEILMSEEEVRKDHPKIKRALQFEQEKKENEKTLIIASTHVRQPISDRERLNEISTELHECLTGCRISLITAYSLYQLWQKAKGGEVNISEVFQRLYSHSGGMFSSEKNQESSSVWLGA